MPGPGSEPGPERGSSTTPTHAAGPAAMSVRRAKETRLFSGRARSTRRGVRAISLPFVSVHFVERSTESGVDLLSVPWVLRDQADLCAAFGGGINLLSGGAVNPGPNPYRTCALGPPSPPPRKLRTTRHDHCGWPRRATRRSRAAKLVQGGEGVVERLGGSGPRRSRTGGAGGRVGGGG